MSGLFPRLRERVSAGEAEWFGPASYGKRLGPDRPEGQLAILEVEHAAKPEQVEKARQFFKEAAPDDFEPLGSKGRRWLHRESGVEYIIVENQVLMEPDPAKTGVEFFAVDGWRIMFFRRRDHDPVEYTVLGRGFTAGQVVQGPDGRDMVIPAKNVPGPWLESSRIPSMKSPS